MSMENIKSLVIVGLVVVLGMMFFGGSTPSLGGLVHNVQETFDAGIAVNGTEVINSSGVYTGNVSGGVVASSNGISVTCAAASSTTFVSGIATACE